jgi:DNA topoisomerase-1
MVIKDGRFGAYVTDGELNATLRRGDEIETITPERAAELLAEKRAEGSGAEEAPAPQESPAQDGARRSRPAAPDGQGSPAKKTAVKKAVARRQRQLR